MGLIQVADVLGITASRASYRDDIDGTPGVAGDSEAADLVTEMREVKHYYSRGVTAGRH